MPSPSRDDADALLKLMEVYLSEPVRKAKQFWRTIPDGLTFDELRAKYPQGSDEFTYVDTMMIFWDTVGLLLKHGLLSEDLVFDSFLDAPPWPKVEAAFLSLRKQEGGALEGENFEFAYRRSLEWREHRTARSTGSRATRKSRIAPH
jgi:hypothetical protein